MIFPPAIAPLLRQRVAQARTSIDGLPDRTLEELLTAVFFAGLEAHEGVRNAIRVVFVGSAEVELLSPDPSSGTPLYRWRLIRFVPPRPFSIVELVRLGVATTDEHVYTQILLEKDELCIGGLAREGTSSEGDTFVTMVASRPGALSIRLGHERVIEYEHGTIVSDGTDIIFESGPVNRALEKAGRGAGLEPELLPRYLEATRAIVTEMAAHGRGGVLVISADERPRCRGPRPTEPRASRHRRRSFASRSICRCTRHRTGATASGACYATRTPPRSIGRSRT